MVFWIVNYHEDMDRETFVDITEVHIDGKLPRKEWLGEVL